MAEKTVNTNAVVKNLHNLFRGYKRDGVDVEDAIQEILDTCPSLDADFVESIAYKVYGS